jgi:hypothetical protein
MRRIISDLNPGSAAVGRCVLYIEVPDISFWIKQQPKIMQLNYDVPVVGRQYYIYANIVQRQGGISGIRLKAKQSDGSFSPLNKQVAGTQQDPIFSYHCFILASSP